MGDGGCGSIVVVVVSLLSCFVRAPLFGLFGLPRALRIPSFISFPYQLQLFCCCKLTLVRVCLFNVFMCVCLGMCLFLLALAQLARFD